MFHGSLDTSKHVVDKRWANQFRPFLFRGSCGLHIRHFVDLLGEWVAHPAITTLRIALKYPGFTHLPEIIPEIAHHQCHRLSSSGVIRERAHGQHDPPRFNSTKARRSG
jgi:hypothetical protein